MVIYLTNRYALHIHFGKRNIHVYSISNTHDKNVFKIWFFFKTLKLHFFTNGKYGIFYTNNIYELTNIVVDVFKIHEFSGNQ